MASFGAYGAAATAAWARRFGHGLLVLTEEELAGPAWAGCGELARRGLGRVAHALKPRLLLRALELAAPEWLLWIDADAAVVDLGEDFVARLLDGSQDGPAELLISMSCFSQVREPAPFNNGVFLLRGSAWARAFLAAVAADPRSSSPGQADQDILAALHREDFMGMRARTRLLPPLAMNTDDLFLARPPAEQPVVHLLGHHIITILSIITNSVL